MGVLGSEDATPPLPARGSAAALMAGTRTWATVGGALLILGTLTPQVGAQASDVVVEGPWGRFASDASGLIAFLVPIMGGVLAILCARKLGGSLRGVALTCLALSLLALPMLYPLPREYMLDHHADAGLGMGAGDGRYLLALGLIVLVTTLVLAGGERSKHSVPLRFGCLAILLALFLPMSEPGSLVVQLGGPDAELLSQTTWPRIVAVVCVLLFGLAAGASSLSVPASSRFLPVARALLWIIIIAWPVLATVVLAHDQWAVASRVTTDLGPRLVRAVATAITFFAVSYGWLMILVAGLVAWLRGNQEAEAGQHEAQD